MKNKKIETQDELPVESQENKRKSFAKAALIGALCGVMFIVAAKFVSTVIT